MISEVATVVQRRIQGEGEGEPPGKAASPEETLRLLGELRSLGMTDEQFGRLHPKRGETIDRHLKYVAERKTFNSGSVNERVNLRLQLCSKFLRARERQTSSETMQQFMDRCVDDAAREIPIH